MIRKMNAICCSFAQAKEIYRREKELSIQNNISQVSQDFFESNVWHADSVTYVSESITESPVVSDSIQRTFFGQSTVEIVPTLRPVLTSEWMSSSLLLVSVIIVLLWFLMPNRKALIHYWRHPFEKPGDGNMRKPGFAFSIVFYLNYMFVLVLFALLSLKQFSLQDSTSFTSIDLFFFISAVVVTYSLGKLVFISLAGFIFDIQSAAHQQLRLYVNQNNLSGFLILGVLFLIFFTGGIFFFYLGLIILLTSNLIKWIQTIAIGKVVTHFKLYHLIIYLCTLELIPLLLLIKLVNF